MTTPKYAVILTVESIKNIYNFPEKPIESPIIKNNDYLIGGIEFYSIESVYQYLFKDCEDYSHPIVFLQLVTFPEEANIYLRKGYFLTDKINYLGRPFRPNETMFIDAMKLNGRNLKYIPKHLQTEAICVAAVDQKP